MLSAQAKTQVDFWRDRAVRAAQLCEWERAANAWLNAASEADDEDVAHALLLNAAEARSGFTQNAHQLSRAS